jgi:hypothetical protein
MQSLERGSIIASNVSTEGDVSAPGLGGTGPDPEAMLSWTGLRSRPGIGTILVRSATLSSAAAVSRAAGFADVYLDMPVDGVGIFGWDSLDDLIERGYSYSLKRLSEARDSLIK